MDMLPLFHRIAGEKVLVLGQGQAADAKRRLVEEAGGVVVAETEPGVRLAFLALPDGAEEKAAELRALGLLVNVADRPALCDFFVPAIVDRSPVLVAIGTGGASASLAKALKERLDIVLPAALGALANAISAARHAVSLRHRSVPERRDYWAAMLRPGGPLDPFVDHGDPAAAIARTVDRPAATTEVTHILLPAANGAPDPSYPDMLPLGVLRQLAQADVVVHASYIPDSVLAFARRDAVRVVGMEPPEGATGRIIVVEREGSIE